MKSNSLIAATPLHPRNMVRSALVLAGALALWTGVAGLAQAHVTLAPEQAAPGARLDAVLRVPHGCSGAATTELRVLVPSGVLDVQLQPKPAGMQSLWRARALTAKAPPASSAGRESCQTTRSGNSLLVHSLRQSWTPGKRFIFQPCSAAVKR